MTDSEINLLITILSALFATLGFIVASCSLHIQRKSSHPNIKVKWLTNSYPQPRENLLLQYSKIERRLYLFMKVAIINKSPIPGSVFDIYIKTLSRRKVYALSDFELSNLPSDVKNALTVFSNSSTLTSGKIKIEPFQKEYVTLVFKPGGEQTVFGKKKFYLVYSTFSQVLDYKTKRFYLNLSNYPPDLNIKEMILTMKETEFY